MVGMGFYGTGRRKSSVARVWLVDGEQKGKVFINGKPLEEYLPRKVWQKVVLEPLEVTGRLSSFEVRINAKGGGVTGQAGAARLGIARALLQSDKNLKPILKKNGFLTQDARVKERKKYGLRKARAAFQYSKR